MCSDGDPGQAAELQDQPAGEPFESRGGEEEHEPESAQPSAGKRPLTERTREQIRQPQSPADDRNERTSILTQQNLFKLKFCIGCSRQG